MTQWAVQVKIAGRWIVDDGTIYLLRDQAESLLAAHHRLGAEARLVSRELPEWRVV